MDISFEIEKLTRGRELTEALFSLVHDIVRGKLKESGETDRADEATKDFLIHLANLPNFTGTTKSALRIAFSRFWTASSQPANHELWRILSAAVRELGTKGQVVRLDGSPTDANSNSVRWILRSYVAEPMPTLDHREFNQRMLQIPVYPEKRSAREDAKILQPEDARTLVLEILDAARAPLDFGDLQANARSHVHLFSLDRTESLDRDNSDTHSDENHSLHEVLSSNRTFTVEDELWLDEEASRVASVVWKKVGDESAHKLICQFMIPKKIHGDKNLTSENFGTSQRVSEDIQQVYDIVAAELKGIDDSQRGEDRYTLIKNLAVEIFMKIERNYCPEICGQ